MGEIWKKKNQHKLRAPACANSLHSGNYPDLLLQAEQEFLGVNADFLMLQDNIPTHR